MGCEDDMGWIEVTSVEMRLEKEGVCVNWGLAQPRQREDNDGGGGGGGGGGTKVNLPGRTRVEPLLRRT